MKQSIVPLQTATNVVVFGGKAVNLGTMLRAGLPVPSGFAVGLSAFGEQGKLLTDAKTLLKNSLRPAVQYAVRSSATVEDGADMSWAGQFESYLYVDSDDVTEKVEKCHQAIKSRARAYADENNQNHTVSVGVVVQEMIDPRFAGVMFTENPVSGKEEIVVEYVQGVGEQLVSGKVTPEDFAWDRKSKEMSSQVKVPFKTEELIEAGLAIETLFDDMPQDIEWAIDKTGKLWITQSRPITTLNIEHVGKGYHYLGDPGDLFYWGPASARPLYMSDFLASVRNKFEQWGNDNTYPKPPKTLLLFHDNKALWLNKKKAFNRFTQDLFEVYVKTGDLEKDINEWSAAIGQIKKDGTNEPDELLAKLDAAWQATLTAEFALYGAEASISSHLRQFTEEERHLIWGTFSLPENANFINKIDQDVIRVNNPEKLADMYPWALNSYAGVAKRSSLVKYFTQRIKDLEGNSEVILGTKAKRDELAKKCKLSTELRKQLSLARRIAEFMDERKAWMMQSRVVIQKIAHAEAKKRNIDVLDIENCRIEDLKNINLEEFFGWTYVSGGSIELSKKDVERSWDWYVEYKAATNILKGIVSSRGGKHFMTGEVVVIHDPAEQVADGKIVVVPSTGPSYVPIMRKAAALITDHGGMMSHAAIVAREFNLPCIVGTVHATKVLKNGDKVVLDLVKGEVNK